MTDRCENCLSRVVFLVPPVPRSRSRRCRASRSSHSSSNTHTYHRPAILLWPGQQRSSRDQALR